MGPDPHGHDPERLRRLVGRLEGRVRALRASRRILLGMLRRVEEQHGRELEQLHRELSDLRVRNRRYAQRIWEQNRRLVELAGDRAEPPTPLP